MEDNLRWFILLMMVVFIIGFITGCFPLRHQEAKKKPPVEAVDKEKNGKITDEFELAEKKEPIPLRIPSGKGQLESKVVWFNSGQKKLGYDVKYAGQAALNGKIILTASNGFFDDGILAKGESDDKDAPNTKPFIGPNYKYLTQLKKGKQMRWHLWFDEPGYFRVIPFIKVSEKLSRAELKFIFADQERVLKAEFVQSPYKQSCDMVFTVPNRGKYSLTVEVLNAYRKNDEIQLYHIDLFGPAVKNAKLLRARWRPAAVHAGYRSSRVKNPRAWVIITKSNADIDSYSPVTTPFGYYGASFDSERRSNSSFNFSMWSYDKKKAPPTECLSHLLALGSPKAEFSGFGHEGTGVKPRNFEALPTRPKENILYLRLENAGKYQRYFGYFLDPVSQDWKLYAVGHKWNGDKKPKALSLGSFVEVPGPPHSERSGDIRREMHRKGWLMDQDGKWHRMDTMKTRNTTNQNKYWSVSDDGWFVMGMGGMEHFDLNLKSIKLPDRFLEEPLPSFLAPEKVKQLYELPVKFGEINVSDISDSSAKIIFELVDAGSGAKATIHYGEEDCLTFPKRKVHGTERSSKAAIKKAFWSHSKNIGPVKVGKNYVMLENLKPNTKYFYRILVCNDHGKMWTFQTFSFKTRSNKTNH